MVGHHLPTAEDLVEDAAVGGVVIDDEHPHPMKTRRFRGQGFGGLAVGQVEADDKVEPASPADFAFHPDTAAHEADQARGDGQAQARAAVAARRRSVGLLEHLEDGRLFLRRDADPRVGDDEVQHHVLFRVGFPRHFQAHLPGLRELDGVADEVDDDLAQAAIVADHHVGHFGMDEAGQFQSLLVRANGKRLHRVAKTFPQVERAAIEREFARFDLREVEDVVDHREQGLARVPDRLEELPLLDRKMALQDQFRHADDRVQWRADLVAHVGQERALGATGGFGSVFGMG